MGARSIDYDSNPEARLNLLSIIEQECRLLTPNEVSWYLNRSLSEVYASVPRVKSLPKPVRFDPGVVKALKTGSQVPLVRSVKTEKKEKSSGFLKPHLRGRKIPLCL